MKNKKLIAIVIVILTVLSVYMGFSSAGDGKGKYKEYIKAAQQFEKEQLYQKAINAYSTALTYEDTPDVRIKVIELYKSAIEIREIEGTGKLVSFILDSLAAYREEAEIYNISVEYLYQIKDYDNLMSALKSAKKYNINTQIVETVRNEVKYMYKSQYSAYDDYINLTNGKYIVKKDGNYYSVNTKLKTVDQAGKFLSPYSVSGYAMCEFAGKVFLMDAQGVRQKYFDSDITASSGLSDGNIACKIGNKYAYYNSSAEKISDDYVFAGRFSNGVAAVKTGENQWILINKDHKQLTKETYDDIILNSADECVAGGIILVKKGNEYNILSVSGYENPGDKPDVKAVKGFSCESCELPVDQKIGSNNGPVWFAFCRNGKWGYADSEGNVKIEPQFKEARSFSNGFAGVTEDGEIWSFIDEEGNVLIEGEFYGAGYFNPAGNCFVKGSGDRWSVISLYYFDA